MPQSTPPPPPNFNGPPPPYLGSPADEGVMGSGGQMEDLRSYVPVYMCSSAFFLLVCVFLADSFFSAVFPAVWGGLGKSQRMEWSSNTASLINSSLTGLGAIVGLLVPGGLSIDTQFAIMQAMVISMTGYSIGDIVFRLYYRKELAKPLFQSFLIAHHIVAIYAVQIAVLFRESFLEKNLFMLMEFSTTFINLRFMLLDAKVNRDSKLYENLSIFMIVTFFLTRILPIPLLYYLVLYKIGFLGEGVSPGNRWYMTSNIIPYTAINLLNFYWFHKMISGISIHLGKKRSGTVRAMDDEIFHQPKTD